MTHIDISSERLSAFLDGELTPSDMDQLSSHIAECPDCQNAVAEARRVRELIQLSLAASTPSSTLQERILASVTRLHQEAQARRLVVMYTFCLALVIAGVTWMVFSPIGRFLRLVFRLLFTAVDSVFRVVASTGLVWPSVIVASSFILGGLAVAAVVRMLKSSEVTV